MQDNVLLPEGFTEFFLTRRQRKRIEVNSESWEGVSLKTGRRAVFFTVVNPIDNQDGLKETLITYFWCNLELAQQRGLHFYQTRSNAVILYDTQLAEFIGKRHA